MFLLYHGNIFQENFSGTNMLIREGAYIFTKTEDLLWKNLLILVFIILMLYVYQDVQQFGQAKLFMLFLNI